MKRLLLLVVIILNSSIMAFGQITFLKMYGGFTAPVVKTRDGGHVAVGTTAASSSGNAVCVIKTDSLGVLQWSNAYYQIGTDEQGGNINTTADGGYIATGFFDTD